MIRHIIFRENRPSDLRYDRRTKPIEINPDIELLTMLLKGQKISGERLIYINLLNEGLKVVVIGLKRLIVLFARKKRFKDLHNMPNVHLDGVYGIYGESQTVGQSDTC